MRWILKDIYALENGVKKGMFFAHWWGRKHPFLKQTLPGVVFRERAWFLFMEDILKVGIISSTHGVRGEVKVFPTTDDVNRFKKLKEVLLDTEKEMLSIQIESVKFFKQFAILKFKGYDNLDDVQQFRGKALFVTRENAVKLKKDEYFIADLIGMSVRSDDDAVKGQLKDVMQTGANDVYVIALEDGRELLLPAIKECVLDISFESNEITIHVLEGLLDE